MLTYVTLDSPDGAVTFHETDKRALAEAVGLVGLAGAREVKHLRPTGHGTVSTSKWVDGRPVSLKGEVWGADGGDAWAEWSALAGGMFSAVDTPRLMKWGIEGGPELQAAVRSLGGVFPTLDGSSMLEYLAQFWADDPRAYAQAETVAPGSTLSVSAGGKVYPFTYPYVFNPSSGGTANLVVAGTVPTPPVIRVFGYASAPLIRLASTGEQIALAGEVGAGRYVDIDIAATDGVKVRLDDGTPLAGLVDYTATTFFELPTGPQTLTLFASDFDASARIEVRYRAAYL